MERVPGGYIGAIPAQNAASRPGVASMEQTLEAMEREGTVPFPGNDPLADYVTLLLDVEDVNGKIIDESGRNHAVQVWNNCIVTENDRRIGSSSMFFNGNSSFIEIPSSYDLHVGSSDFTLECWFKILTQKEQAIVSKEQVSTGTSGILLYIQSNLTLTFLAGNGSSWFVSMTTSFTPLPGVWYHVAVSRNERTWAMFVDGTIVGFAISSSGVWYGQTSRPLQIGRYGPWNDATKDFHGYIDKVRLTERAVRYFPNFSVATSELPTNTSGDPYFNNVNLLLLMNGSNGSTTFTDSSSSGLTVTANGNAQISTAQSKFGGASALFDGNGDYLSLPNLSSLYLGNADFTFEMWVYPLSAEAGEFLFWNANSNAYGLRLNISASQLSFLATLDGTSHAINASAGTINANQWAHVSIVRSGTRIGVFLNGVVTYINASFSGVMNPGSLNIIGGRTAFPNYFNGYIDDLRITKGVARYLAPFTPPSRPVGFNPVKTGDPYFMDVGLLLRAEGSDGSRTFTDSSRRNLAITPVGGTNTITVNDNAQISTAQSKFGGSSAYFDGTNDFIGIANGPQFAFGVQDFTIEFWFYPISVSDGVLLSGWSPSGSVSGFACAFSSGVVALTTVVSDTYIGTTGPSTITANQWYHYAATRKSGVIRVFINGISGTPVSDARSIDTQSAGINIGWSTYTANRRPYNGYIDDVRITKGVARYTSNFAPPSTPNPTNINDDPFYQNVSLLMSMNGTNGSTVFTDSSIIGSAVSTITSKVGSASAFFKGDGYLSIPDSDAFNFAASDFTVEAWIRPVGNSGNNNGTYFSCIAASDVSGSRAWTIFLGGTPTSMDRLIFEGYTNNTTVTVVSVPYNFAMNTWYHMAIARAQNRLFMFINGKLLNKDGTAFSITMQDSASVLKIGAHDYDGTYKYYFNGFIDELRITKNVARYISDFTPSTSPLPDSYKATGADPYGKYTTFLLRAEGPNGYTLIRDSSYMDNPVTINGNAAISTADKKFGNSSLYFDGTGDYLSVPNDILRFEREDFTIEFWIKLETNTVTYPYILSSSIYNANSGFYIITKGPATGWGGTGRISFNGSTGSNGPGIESTTNIRDNAWHHIAITRSESLHTLWIDGIPEYFANSASANYTGNGGLIFNDVGTPASGTEKGYLDEMRITRGFARYNALSFMKPTSELPSDTSTKLLLNMNGSNNSTVFTDSGPSSITIANSGSPIISTSQSAYGGSSGYFNGSSYLTATISGGLGTVFTLEFWYYKTSNSGFIFNCRTSGTGSDGLDIRHDLEVTSASTFIFSATTVPLNTWTHISIMRLDSTGRMIRLINGVVNGTNTITNTFSGTTFRVGGSPEGNVGYLTGYMDDLRISNVRRYPSTSFTPPTAAFPDP